MKIQKTRPSNKIDSWKIAKSDEKACACRGVRKEFEISKIIVVNVKYVIVFRKSSRPTLYLTTTTLMEMIVDVNYYCYGYT